MSLFSLKDIRNHPRRSAFDLSSKVAFSAKSGELLPIKWYFTMPGDKFTLKRQHFTRTQPVNTSAYTRIREYYDWFWCLFIFYGVMLLRLFLKCSLMFSTQVLNLLL